MLAHVSAYNPTSRLHSSSLGRLLLLDGDGVCGDPANVLGDPALKGGIKCRVPSLGIALTQKLNTSTNLGHALEVAVEVFSKRRRGQVLAQLTGHRYGCRSGQ